MRSSAIFTSSERIVSSTFRPIVAQFQVAHENLARPRLLQFLAHSTNCTRVQTPDMAAPTRKRYAIVEEINSSRERNRSHQSAEANMNCCNVKFEHNCIGPLYSFKHTGLHCMEGQVCRTIPLNYCLNHNYVCLIW